MPTHSSLAKAGFLAMLLVLQWPAVGFSEPVIDPLSDLINQVGAGKCSPDYQVSENSLYPVDKAALDRIEQAIKRYARIVRAGGWPAISDGKTILLGDKDTRVPLLRTRLRLTGDLLDAVSTEETNVADAALIDAARQFQRRHGIGADGRIGRLTISAMNVPAVSRLTQLQTNLRRLSRLRSDDRAYRYVMVNIPDYSLVAIQDQSVVLSSRVIVGRTDRQTPQFSTAIRSVTFHPIWTVPPSIVRRDLYPKFRSNPDYFSRGDFLLSSATDGLLIDPTVLPDILLTPNMVRIQQLPGPKNALGMIRLDMPNRYAVFLHDTPSRNLFEQDKRTMSSGCIRVQEIIELTEWLLVEHPGWNRNRIDSVLADTTTPLTVHLPERVPVFLIYITAWVADDLLIPQFRQDIYQLDSLPVAIGP